MKHLGDITKISGYTVPAVDCIIGGSPCQDLSVAGKRAGLDGERSGLYMEQIRIVKELRDNDKRNGRSGVDVRPRYMLWENVPGAFSSNKAEDFRIVLEEIAKICDENAVIPMPPKGKWTNRGCIVGDGWSVAWRVFDAHFWGVPQRRRRIALVADFGGQSAPEILFVRKSVSGYLDESGTQGEGIGADFQGSIGADDREGKFAIVWSAGFKELNSAKARSNGWGEEIAPTLSASKHDASVVIGFDAYNQCTTGNKAKTLTAERSDTEHVPVVLTLTHTHAGEPAICYGINGDKAGTLDSSYYKGCGMRSGVEREVVAQLVSNIRYIVRRLTPLECERLQGYPDGWTDIGEWTDSKGKVHKTSDAARYKALGNSIALPPWKWVLKRLCACYERDATMASLFDGIGGFPYLWEQFNGKGSCLWASEIEEFPMAVTKIRIGE